MTTSPRRLAPSQPRRGSTPRGRRPVSRRRLPAPVPAVRRRLVGLLVAVALAFVVIAGRLADIQGLSAAHYAALGVSQRLRSVILPAARGTIFDRNLRELAMSVQRPTIWANPHLVTDPRGEAQALSPLLGLTVDDLETRLSHPAGFVYLARKVEPNLAAKVKALKLDGVFFLDEPKRFLPSGDVAAPLIGQVGTDNGGLSGLEQEYQKRLAGRPGKLLMEEDPRGGEIPGGLHRYQASQAGQDLVLTVDESLQYEAEQALAAEIQTSQAKGGMALVMDSTTGEILAMANLVASANGTDPPVAAPNAMALTNVYEPGSVNKLITISAALQEGVVKPNDHLTVPNTITVAGQVFREHVEHQVGQWSITDIVANSSNVGTITIGGMLGKTRLDSYMRAFGFGKRTSLNFPGESGGLLLDPKKWYSTSIATVPIGQGVAVTATQMLSAYNAIANGGVYVAPKLVRSMVDGEGRQHLTAPSEHHRVVSAEVAKQMSVMLDEVVRIGTGTKAAINGYSVAGKTGTARKPEGGAYKVGAYVSSFAGFVPSQKPAFTAMVVIDEPSFSIYGADVAAPVFARISQYALREFRIPPPAGGLLSDPAVPLATPAGAMLAGEVGAPVDPKVTAPAAGASTTTSPSTSLAPARTAPAATSTTVPTTAPPTTSAPTTTPRQATTTTTAPRPTTTAPPSSLPPTTGPPAPSLPPTTRPPQP